MLTPNNFTPDQIKAIDHLFSVDECMLVAPKGFGKCIVGYTAISDLLNDGVLKRVLVLSTAQVCTMVWATEGAKWSHIKTNSIVCLTGNPEKKRICLMAENSQIVVCNFENLAWLFKTYPKHNFDGLLVDEITKLKAVGGVGFKKLRTQTKNFSWRVGMTADPVAQESLEIYGPMLIIDRGKRLGRNNDRFKRRYFMQMDYMGYDWGFQIGGLTRLTNVLKDVIYTVNSKEYVRHLPELRDIEITFDLPDVARKCYNDMVKHNTCEVGGCDIVAPNEAVLQGKLFQICCGTVYHQEEFDTFKTEIFIHDAKMQLLHKLMLKIDTPVLIAYQFSFQRDALVAAYDAPVFSAKNGEKRNAELLKKWESGEIPAMLIHPKSAGHGLNLQYGPGHTLICLGYFWSADEWDQLIGRLVRQGQKSLFVERYTICSKNTLEARVMKAKLNDRKNASDMFHEYLNTVHQSPYEGELS